MSMIHCTFALSLGLELLLAFDAPAAEGTTGDYKVSSQDLLVINLVGEKDLPVDYRVSSQGTISFPYLEAVEVEGKTTREIETAIKLRLHKEDYMVNPQVTVQVREYRKRFATVLGQVNRPGPVELPGELKLDLLTVIASAGGFTRMAKEGSIQVTRGGKVTTYNLKKMLTQKTPNSTLIIQDGDVVYIPETVF